MNQIKFQVVSTVEWFGDAIDIEVDGNSLVELVREFELPMATAEESPRIAGGYMGIAAVSYLPPSNHFFGIHDPPRSDDTKTDILWCRDCGEPGCWPLRVKISVDADRVTWSEFEQPHRKSSDKVAAWGYDGFGPIVFDRRQYESSLNNAKGSHT